MDGGPSVTSVPGSGSVLSGGTAPEDEGALTTGVHLQLLFQYYCRFGRSGTDHDIDTLDNAMYAKFTRDCPGLLARPLGAAECDLLFLKHKAKALRRATYGQWLDILSDMAAAKYPDLLADGSALPTLLSSNILCSSPALGIAEAVRGGLIRVEAAVSGPLQAGPRSRSPSLRRARSPSRSPSAAAAGRSFSPACSVRVAGGGGSSSSGSGSGGGGGGGASPSAPPSPAAPTPAAAAGAPSASASSFASYMQAAAAQMAALAAQAASAADAVTAAAMATAEGGGSSGGSAGAGAGAAAPTPLLQRSASPSAVYQVLARTAKDFQVAAAAAAVASSQQQQQQQQQQQRPGSPARSENLPHGSGSAGSASGGARALRPLSASQRSVLSSSSAASATSSAMHGALSTGGGGGGGGAPLRLASPNPFRAVPLASGEFVISSQSLGAGGSGASRAPPPPPRSPGGGRYEHLGTPLFTPALAGEANAPGSVYERLANPESFTGVYRRAWESDGRINQYADTSASLKPSAFVGNTNTCSDETITDIRTTLRPNLSHQPALGINRVSGRPAFR